jgi:mannose-6-phosphate isomerase-like protein (cupin superfamily)
MAGLKHLKVSNWRDFPERSATGGLKTRRVFAAADGEDYRSGFRFAQYNYLAPGEANETHVHHDIEKIYFVIQGKVLVKCGPEESIAGPGDFFFLPVDIEHSVENIGSDEAQMTVCAIRIDER